MSRFGRSPMPMFAAALLAAALFASCAGAPPGRPAGAPTASRPAEKKAAANKAPPERAVPGAELAGPAFASLPDEARSYLAALAESFKAGNAAFILAQGEPSYAARNRPILDGAQYAALLYRVGPYSEEGPDATNALPRFDAATAASLRFTGWTDRGPVAEVRGKVGLRDGSNLPCTIYLLWKALPPRILGREP